MASFQRFPILCGENFFQQPYSVMSDPLILPAQRENQIMHERQM